MCSPFHKNLKDWLTATHSTHTLNGRIEGLMGWLGADGWIHFLAMVRLSQAWEFSSDSWSIVKANWSSLAGPYLGPKFISRNLTCFIQELLGSTLPPSLMYPQRAVEREVQGHKYVPIYLCRYTVAHIVRQVLDENNCNVTPEIHPKIISKSSTE